MNTYAHELPGAEHALGLPSVPISAIQSISSLGVTQLLESPIEIRILCVSDPGLRQPLKRT